jgi:hypothetical protein
LADFLDQIMRDLGNRRLVLLIDEYELISEKVREGRISSAVYHFLNSVLERHPKLSLVLTGSRRLDADPQWAALVGKALYREISFLGRKDTENLITRPLRGTTFYQAAAVRDLWILTHGQPFFCQLLCQTLVEILNESRVCSVSRRIVDQAVKRIAEHPPPQLLYQWSTFSPAEKLLLSALATLAKSPAAYVSWERLQRLISSLPEERRLGLDAVEVRIHLEGLRQRAILERDQPKYRFTMDLLRLWIQAEHGLWNVLHELR